jgi:predicted phosphate transport protein (TIGR00153 family)
MVCQAKSADHSIHLQGSVMFKFLFKKERQVQELIFKYLDNLKKTQEHFEKAMDCYFDFGLGENCDFLIAQTHKFESRADDLRNDIIEMMYSKVLIPESRGDIFRLLESLDLILDHFEAVLFMVQGQKIRIPAFVVPELREFIRVSLECCDLVFRQVEAYFKKTEDIKPLVSTIDSHESRCDHMEREIVSKIFDSDMGPFPKLQLKELVGKIGEISDQADRVSRSVYIINIKRRV